MLRELPDLKGQAVKFDDIAELISQFHLDKGVMTGLGLILIVSVNQTEIVSLKHYSSIQMVLLHCMSLARKWTCVP